MAIPPPPPSPPPRWLCLLPCNVPCSPPTHALFALSDLYNPLLLPLTHPPPWLPPGLSSGLHHLGIHPPHQVHTFIWTVDSAMAHKVTMTLTSAFAGVNFAPCSSCAAQLTHLRQDSVQLIYMCSEHDQVFTQVCTNVSRVPRVACCSTCTVTVWLQLACTMLHAYCTHAL